MMEFSIPNPPGFVYNQRGKNLLADEITLLTKLLHTVVSISYKRIRLKLNLFCQSIHGIFWHQGLIFITVSLARLYFMYSEFYEVNQEVKPINYLNCLVSSK
jgi:hypothetical protein